MELAALHPLFLVTASEALRADLAVRCRAAYDIRPLSPEEVLRWSVDDLSGTLAAGVAVLVEWREEAAAVIPIARRAAGPHRVPVFALCRAAATEHVAALVMGADGTLETPVGPVLLEARLLAHRRLVAALAPGAGDGTPLPMPAAPRPAAPEGCHVGALVLDAAARTIFVDGRELLLTPREFTLLAYLMRHAGHCRTRDEILDDAWGIGFDTGTNILDVHIYELRKKLRPFALDGLLQTIRGVGFRLVHPG